MLGELIRMTHYLKSMIGWSELTSDICRQHEACGTEEWNELCAINSGVRQKLRMRPGISTGAT